MNNITYTDSKGNVGVLNTIAVQEITDNLTLTVHDSGKNVLVGIDGKSITLPPTMKGLKFTFINIGDAGNNIVKVSPAATDGISGTVGAVTLDGTINKSAQNTKGTSKTGDNITIIGTGVKGPKAWIVVTGTGVWAKEA
ncbi:hypothetical protein [Chryseobacterium sp. JK1]|uniref:hypothetical protein n=1 Tax=Chryseobacterium sp. JK1 TaxID=874294 RepID=UPI003D68EA71